MALFDRSHMTSYQLAIVSKALLCLVTCSRYLMLKNLVTLKCNYWCAAIKTAFFHHFYPPSSLIESLRMSVHTKFGLKKGSSQLPRLSDGYTCMNLWLSVLTQHQHVTDRQTDMLHIANSCMHSKCKTKNK